MSAPLILAIQPDRRQASQLTSIARRVSAELVLTESAATAILMLGERVPDLILTPPLLSHKDEMALTERLRELGSAGSHIQTLTIPILETAESLSPQGVLSSLRKPKRKGKAHASETVGCTADTFAEQVSIYLSRALRARPTSAPLPEEPAAASVAAPTPTPPEPEVAKQAESSPPEAEASMADRLPTIEQLSARTPAVPEPVRSVATRIDAITALVPSASVVPAPSTGPVETRMDAIAALVPRASGGADNPPVPVPQSTSHVAELSMELPFSPTRETVSAPALPSVQVHTNMEAVAAMIPVAKTAEGAPPVPVPGTTPPVAALPIDLSSVEQASEKLDPATLILPAASIETGLDALAAMVPLVKVAGSAPAPVAAIPQIAELPMELPPMEPAAHLQTTAAFVSAPSVGVVEVSIAAVAAMMPGADASTDRTVPIPAMTPYVGELPMTLPPTEAVPMHAVMPAVPESAASVEMNMQAVARMVPAVSAHDRSPVALPPAARVNELTVQLSPSDMLASASQKAPGLPASLAEATIDAFAAIAPLASTVTKNRSVPVPALVPYVAELPMPLAAMTAVAPVDTRIIVVPPPPAALAKTNVEALAAIVSDVEAPADVRETPESSTAVIAIRRKTKKKATMKDRKAARKLERSRSDRLDDSSLFDPEECRFSALVAKLDEVVADTDESAPPAGAVGAQRQVRKRRTTARHA